MTTRAFSLVEVMISAALFAAGLAALLTAFSTATRTEQHQERTTTAMHLAEAQLENLLLLYPDAPELSATGPTLLFDTDGRPVASGGKFSLVSTVADGPIPRTRKLTVTVTWTEAGSSRSLVLFTHRT